MKSPVAEEMQALAKRVNKKSKEKEEVITAGGEDLLSNPRFKISTGLPTLDIAVGGGIPTGRVMEVFGMESSGKSTLVAQIATQCQRMGGFVCLIDHESSFERNYAQELGLDVDKMLFIQTPTVEDTFSTIYEVLNDQSENRTEAYECNKCKKISPKGDVCSAKDCSSRRMKALPPDHDARRRPILIIWDTIAAAPTKKERAELAWGEGKEMAGKAREISSRMRNLVARLGEVDASMIFVNQMYQGIGPYAKATTPGGQAIKYYCSLRLRMHGGRTIFEAPPEEAKEEEKTDKKPDKKERLKKAKRGWAGVPRGKDCTITVVKSKVRRPDSVIELPLIYGRGFDDTEFMLQILLRAGKAKKSGAWYYLYMPFTQKQAEALQGGKFQAVEEDGQTFLKLHGSDAFGKALEAAPTLRTPLRKLLTECEDYV